MHVMIEDTIKSAIDAAREQLQSQYPECATCRHKGEKHGMNCLECCPVERRQLSEANAPADLPAVSGKVRRDVGGAS